MISEATRSPLEIAEELRPPILRLAGNLRRETEALGVTSHQATLLWLVRVAARAVAAGARRGGRHLRAVALGHVDRLEAPDCSAVSARATTAAAWASS